MNGFDEHWLAEQRRRGRVVADTAGLTASERAKLPRDGDDWVRWDHGRFGADFTEEQIQREIINWCRAHESKHPELAWIFHCPNGELRSKATGGRLRAMGVRAGLPDLMLLHRSGPWAGLAIELKAGINDLSDEQVIWLRRFIDQGWAVTSVWTYSQAEAAIIEYLTEPDDFIGGL